MEKQQSVLVIETLAIVLPGGNLADSKHYVVVKNGVIEEVVEGEYYGTIENALVVKTELLIPGFVDIHTHGLFCPFL